MKDLLEYNFPQDIKSMTNDELSLLAYQIRDFLIDKVSNTGGHIASNLGVVELTIALHKVFNCPNDKIIFDVGHQSYVHKILTGRAKDFDSLRQFGGLSGFPKSEESIYDSFNTGHSSNSISVALGMATARDLKHENYEVIPVIGDGSLANGLAFEALDILGTKKSNVIIVLNDNGMSISKNVGGLSKYLSEIRTSESYLNAKNFIKNKIGSKESGKNIAQGLANFKNDIKYSILNNYGTFFESLGITYFGPVDGHNISELITTFEAAKSLNEPCIIHCVTKKGKGYVNAEKQPRKFHGIGPFDKETGEEKNLATFPSFTKIMGKHLLDIAQSDEKVFAITAAMGMGTGLKEFSLAIPNRYCDVGIAEEHAVSFAAGLAKEGYKPCVCIYSTFLQRAYDQIMIDVCMQSLPVTFLIDRAGIVGQDGETHQGIFDISYLKTFPNMTIFCPYNKRTLIESMDKAINYGSPCAVRYPRGDALNTDIKEVNHKKPTVQVLAIGKMATLGSQIAEELNQIGIVCNLSIPLVIKPFDLKTINKNAELIVTIEDNVYQSGFGEEINSLLVNNKVNVINFGWPEKFIEHGTFNELSNKYGLTKEMIIERIKKEIK